MFAIWLMFNKEDQNYLHKIISNLSKQYHTIPFLPHITIYGLVDESLSNIRRVVLQSIGKIRSFPVKVNKLSFSDYFWKTLFIQFDNNDSMITINQYLENYFKKNYDFSPHASLIYKKMNISEKEKIIQSLNIKYEFHIDRIGIQKFDSDITKWNVVEEHQL